MKNQYFGDVNDYCKYGLLRALTGRSRLSLAVCWTLTPDDGRTDGRFTEYLCQPDPWRASDPDLYDVLYDAVVVQGQRDVGAVARAGLLPGARLYDLLLPDDAAGRERYFCAFWKMAKGCDLVFFDPDNGMEVKSRRYGRRDSSKYLYWHELVRAYTSGHSVLVYQHFPRVQRNAFVARLAQEMGERTGARVVVSIRTSRVVYFLLVQEQMIETVELAVEVVDQTWPEQFVIQWHKCVRGATWQRV